jgi:hypothetical protein
MEGKAWRKIPNWPHGFSCSIHQAQGHLCQYTIGGRTMSKLSIWILEDYGTNNKWTLKHTISLRKLFGKTKKQMGYFDFESCYIAVIVHPEWNLVFFVGVGVERAIIAYNMDSRKVHAIPTYYILYGRHDILPEIIGRPYYLSYVPLFLELELLAK